MLQFIFLSLEAHDTPQSQIIGNSMIHSIISMTKMNIYRCSSSYNQKNKQEINKYDVLYDTSPQYVFIKSSKTNTNCGLDNDRKDNVTTQILRITFCRKLHSLELIKNQAYTCISLTLQSTLLLNSPKRFLKDMMTFLIINNKF